MYTVRRELCFEVQNYNSILSRRKSKNHAQMGRVTMTCDFSVTHIWLEKLDAIPVGYVTVNQ
jgi:hypothetical protein